MSDADRDRPKAFDFRINRTRTAAPKEPEPCEEPGCRQAGTCKTPAARNNLRRFRMLCPDHARAFNERWDFFKGMTEGEVEHFQREALTGHRPTWRLGDRSSAPYQARGAKAQWAGRVTDSYAVFEDGEIALARNERPKRPVRVLLPMQRAALDTLGLPESASLNEVKARYKDLVKRHHPDANGGDRSAEERLAQVIRAYQVLKKSSFS